MARALIVGCGCRGRALGDRLIREGWTVRGTSRRAEGLSAIEAAGLEAAQADPARPATVLELIEDVTAVVWPFGSATGDVAELEAIHGSSLRRVLERLVETPVRRFVYESAGTVPARQLEAGAASVLAAGERWRIPVGIVEAASAPPAAWVDSAMAALRLTAD